MRWLNYLFWYWWVERLGVLFLWFLLSAGALMLAKAPPESRAAGWGRGAFYANLGALGSVAGILIGLWIIWITLMIALLRIAATLR